MKRQTRSSVSFRAEVFVRLQRYANSRNVPVAALLEQLVVQHLDAEQQPAVGRVEAIRLLRPKKEQVQEVPHGQFFTF